ncbi:MAG TPA: DUF1360 domain-containing protein [Patescibacteria group bacterium]|nr:DUF1360 domain-containing protein [Patescibacteria group bacterium]
MSKKLFKWLWLDIFAFAGINAYVLYYHTSTVVGAVVGFSLGQLVIFGMATYRAANIISNEVVTKPIRAPFVNEVEEKGKQVEKAKPTGILGNIGHLISCPSCTGV